MCQNAFFGYYSEDHNQLIEHKKSCFAAYFFIFIYGGKMGTAATQAFKVWTLKSQQKVDSLDGPFGPTVITKSCFQNFQTYLYPNLKSYLIVWLPRSLYRIKNINPSRSDHVFGKKHTKHEISVLKIYLLHFSR